VSTDTTKAMDIAIRISAVALLAFSCFQIASPFINPIIWAGIIAIGVYPVFEMMREKTGLSPGWASTILTVLMLAILIVPSYKLTEALIDNSQQLSKYLQDDELTIPPPGENIGDMPIIGEKLDEFWQKASDNPESVLGEFEPQITALMKSFTSAAAMASLNILVFVFSIILSGVFIASASGVKDSLENVFTRLAGERGPELMSLSKDTVQSVVRGILGIALLQTILAGIGFLVIGIPAAGLLAVICLVLAVVQIDILIVLIPLSILVFSNPETGTLAAVAFLVWNIIVGLMNNVLKPILLAQGVEAPMAVIFIGAIGGMMLSGIIGLFVGAVVMVLGYTLFLSWVREAHQA